MMKVVLTKHARQRMQERGISIREIEAALLKPDVTTKMADGQTIVVKFIGSKTLEVIYVVEEGHPIILTAYYAS